MNEAPADTMRVKDNQLKKALRRIEGTSNVLIYQYGFLRRLMPIYKQSQTPNFSLIIQRSKPTLPTELASSQNTFTTEQMPRFNDSVTFEVERGHNRISSKASLQPSQYASTTRDLNGPWKRSGSELGEASVNKRSQYAPARGAPSNSYSRAYIGGPSVAPSQTRTYMTQRTNDTVAQKRKQAGLGEVMRKNMLLPGVIIRGLLVEQWVGSSNGTEHYRQDTKWGALCGKMRPMIIVTCYDDHFIAVPMYTHDGKGLSNILSTEEHVSIKDPRSKGDFVALSKHEPLSITAFHPGSYFEKAEVVLNSTCNIARPVSRSYGLPHFKEGRIDDASLKRLMRLFMQYVPK